MANNTATEGMGGAGSSELAEEFGVPAFRKKLSCDLQFTDEEATTACDLITAAAALIKANNVTSVGSSSVRWLRGVASGCLSVYRKPVIFLSVCRTLVVRAGKRAGTSDCYICNVGGGGMGRRERIHVASTRGKRKDADKLCKPQEPKHWQACTAFIVAGLRSIKGSASGGKSQDQPAETKLTTAGEPKCSLTAILRLFGIRCVTSLAPHRRLSGLKYSFG